MSRTEHQMNVMLPDITQAPVPRRTALKTLGVAAALTGVGSYLAACGGKSDSSGSGGSSGSGAGGGAKVLNFYNWTAYIDDSSEPKSQRTIPLFESQTGIKVNYRTYATNDELLAKIRDGGSGFDLIVPSDYLAKRLIESKKVQKLDQAKIPNLANLAPKYRSFSYDPGNQYTVTWANGNTGIGYNTKAVTEKVTDASIFSNSKYKGKMTLLDEMRSTVELALLYLGMDKFESDPAKLDKAFDQLAAWKQNAAIDSDYQDKLGKGDIVVAHAYSGDVYQQIDAGAKDLTYVIPTQGADQYCDVMCIPTDAAHADNANTFINYAYEPEVSARLMQAITYKNGNEKAYPLLPEALRTNPVVFPPPDVEARLYFLYDLPEATEVKWRERWDKLAAK